jgi:peroxiredoxin
VKFVKSVVLSCILLVTALASTPKVGERVPQFSLPSADGSSVSLSDFAGKKLVLVFYRGYW